MSFRSKTLNDLVTLGIQMNDPSLLADVVNIFLEEAPIQAVELESAAARFDAEMVVFFAHKLKTSSSVVGALNISDMCVKIENRAAVSMATIPSLITQLKAALASEYTTINLEMETYRANQKKV